MSKNLKDRIALLKQEQEQLKARAQQLQSQFNAKERANTNRRKYIVGSLVLKDIETNTGLRNHLLKLLTIAPERDKKPFPDLLPIATGQPVN